MKSRLECDLCPHHCKLSEGQVGFCRVRGHQEGRIVSLNYAEVAAWHLDPIEKKPLYHFYPGSQIFSVGGYGCNLRCFYCQNHEISQKREAGHAVTPPELARRACFEESIGVCFTYSEPLVWYEMILETAPLVKAQGGKVVLVSNGIIEGKYLDQLIPHLDAANIDLKAFQEPFYRKHAGGQLNWVLQTIEKLSDQVHTEITTLVIPTLNDSPAEIEQAATWIARHGNLPWHLSRYHPMYQSTIPAAEPEELTALWQRAKEILPYVYLGNMPGGSHTNCPQCGIEVITRSYQVKMHTQEGKCPSCGKPIYGVGLQ